ncbi:MAG: hypothetical protein IPM36_24760 [Lewinellaceae bacterium]|nr:hypothetical protein [Lewinellaceae bacterium]
MGTHPVRRVPMPALSTCMDPTNSCILYASTWRIRRTISTARAAAAPAWPLESTDSGDTWTEITRK